MRTFARRARRLVQRRIARHRVGDEPERADVLGGLHVLARVADGDDVVGRVAADAHVAGDGVRLRRPARDEVVGADLVERDERRRAAMDAAVVDEAQPAEPALGEQRVGLGGVDEAAEEVRDLAVAMPGVVVLQAPRVVLEQQRGGAGGLDLVVDRAGAAGVRA